MMPISTMILREYVDDMERGVSCDISEDEKNNAGLLSIGPLGTNFTEILNEIYKFSFKVMYLKMSSVKWLPFCLGLNSVFRS